MRVSQDPLEYGGGAYRSRGRDRAGFHQTVCIDQGGRQQYGTHIVGRTDRVAASDRGNQCGRYRRILSQWKDTVETGYRKSAGRNRDRRER